jgi:hypothetical protein
MKMKKILFLVLGILVFWLAGVYWAIHWIDKKELFEVSNGKELVIARFLWASSPAINREADAKRALKFSWLQASTEIYREKKTTTEIIDILSEETSFIGKYVQSHDRSLSPEIKQSAFIQIFTYLNRMELFQNYSADPAFEAKLTAFGQKANSLNPENQEDWYREMMIHGRLIGSEETYQTNRDRYLQLANQYRGDVPSAFIDGVIDFYDGVLSCIAQETDGTALQHLQSAAKELAAYPQYEKVLFSSDLNVLLLAKGMKAGSGCRDAIRNV